MHESRLKQDSAMDSASDKLQQKSVKIPEQFQKKSEHTVLQKKKEESVFLSMTAFIANHVLFKMYVMYAQTKERILHAATADDASNTAKIMRKNIAYF